MCQQFHLPQAAQRAFRLCPPPPVPAAAGTRPALGCRHNPPAAGCKPPLLLSQHLHCSGALVVCTVLVCACAGPMVSPPCWQCTTRRRGHSCTWWSRQVGGGAAHAAIDSSAFAAWWLLCGVLCCTHQMPARAARESKSGDVDGGCRQCVHLVRVRALQGSANSSETGTCDAVHTARWRRMCLNQAPLWCLIATHPLQHRSMHSTTCVASFAGVFAAFYFAEAGMVTVSFCITSAAVGCMHCLHCGCSVSSLSNRRGTPLLWHGSWQGAPVGQDRD